MIAATASTLGGILGLFVWCGVFIIIVLICLQRRRIQNVQQRRRREIHSVGTDIHHNHIAGSSHLKNQQSIAQKDHEQIADTEDNDDNAYDDIVTVANLTKVNLIKNREKFITADRGETIGDHDSEYGDYDDIIVISTSMASQPPLGSLTTYNINPAYTTCQEYLAIDDTSETQSDLDDYENADEVSLSGELIDKDAYTKEDRNYLQIISHDITTTSSNCYTTVASPQANTSSESSAPSDVPKSKLTNESQFSTQFHNNDISQRGFVVHHYQSTPSDKGTNSTLDTDMDYGGNTCEGEGSATKCPNLSSTDTDQLDHVYNSADSMEKSDQAISNIKEIGDVGEFDASATDVKDRDLNQSFDDPIYMFDRLDPDYTYDRLSPCIFTDPEQLHTDKSSDSNNVRGFIGDLSHSQISPVMHRQDKWSDEDIMRANAICQGATIATPSKKPKSGMLDKTFGTLV